MKKNVESFGDILPLRRIKYKRQLKQYLKYFMAKYIICDNCKKLIEYNPETKYEGGTSYTTIRCPLCGHVKQTSTNHIHYGLDGKR